MEVIKKVIKKAGVGKDYFFKIQLTQSIDDMGMFSDFEFTPAPVLNKTLTMNDKMFRLSGVELNKWYVKGGNITGTTDSKLESLRTYSASNKYQVGFNINASSYENFEGIQIDGVTRVTNKVGTMISYTFDASDDTNIGTINQSTGISYINDIIDNETEFKFKSEGWNSSNSSLMAIAKDEYLMGIINPPEVENDVFIDRGVVTVMENHLRMSEIESLDHLTRYGNGFFNIVR